MNGNNSHINYDILYDIFVDIINNILKGETTDEEDNSLH